MCLSLTRKAPASALSVSFLPWLRICSCRSFGRLSRPGCVIRFSFARLRREQPRARPKNPTIGPVLFAEENLPLPRIAVIPPRQQPEVLAEIPICCCQLRFELLAKDLLCRPRLTGNLGEAQEKRLRQPSAAHGIDANGLPFRGALQNHGVEILNSPGEFGPAAQNLVELLDFFVQSGRAFEIQLLAGFLAFSFDGGTQRSATGLQELHQAPHFDVVFLFGTAREAWREAHFHFGVETAWKRGIAADFDLAAPHFE